MPDSKSCPDCSTLLPAASFYRNDTHLDGLGTRCNKCERLRQTESRTRRAESLPPVLPAVKRCGGRCGRVLPLAAFVRDLSAADRRYNTCRQCASMQKRQQSARANSCEQSGAPFPPFSGLLHPTRLRLGQRSACSSDHRRCHATCLPEPELLASSRRKRKPSTALAPPPLMNIRCPQKGAFRKRLPGTVTMMLPASVVSWVFT